MVRNVLSPIDSDLAVQLLKKFILALNKPTYLLTDAKFNFRKARDQYYAAPTQRHEVLEWVSLQVKKEALAMLVHLKCLN